MEKKNAENMQNIENLVLRCLVKAKLFRNNSTHVQDMARDVTCHVHHRDSLTLKFHDAFKIRCCAYIVKECDKTFR